MRIGPYELAGELGRGGMGVVYRARRADLDREFALKVVPPGALGSPQAVARLRREAQAAARLATVEGVVGVHDVGEDDGRVYIAMDFVDGQPLDHLIGGGELTPWQSAEIVTAAARAVQAAHELGVLHRDLKPANILVDRASVTFVADFGLAKVTAADAEMTRLTKSGELVGTPAYMPPEQVRGEPLDARADVYALGATLYEALGGRPPFPGDSIHGVLQRVLQEEPPSLRTLDGRIPRTLEAVVYKALAKRPADRYGSAGEMADDLERFLSGTAVTARLPSKRERIQRWARRHRLVLGALALAAVGAGATVAVLLDTRREQRAIEQTTESLTTTELANRLSAAYLELARATAEPMGRLEDHWQGERLPAAAAAAALAEVRTAAESVRARYPGTRVAGAWLKLAELLAGEPVALAPTLELIAELEAMGTTDPFPRMLAARLAIGAVAIHVHVKTVLFSGDGARVPDYDPPANERRLLTRSVELVGTVVDHPVWAKLDHGGAYRDFAQAAVAFAERDYDAGAALLGPLVDDPLLERGAAPLLGMCHFFSGRFAEAAGVWERPVLDRWVAVRRNAAIARMGAAEQARRRAEDPTPHYQRVVGHIDASLHDPREARFARAIRAHAQYRWAEYTLHRGEPGVAELLAGVEADYAVILARSPEYAGALNGIGLMHALRAKLARREGRSPIPHFELAATFYERSAGPTEPVGYSNLANVLRDLAAARAAAGEEPLPTLRRAVAAGDAAVAATVDYPEAPTARGHARVDLALRLAELGEEREAESQFQAAIADFERTLRRLPDHSDSLILRSDTLRRLGAFRAARGGEFEGDFQAAEDGLEAFLQRFPEAVEARFARGELRREWGALREARHQPFADQERGALEDLSRALQVNPGHRAARTTRGNLYKAMGRREMLAGTDPRPTFRRALNDYDEVIRAHPGYDGGWVNRGSVHADLAEAAALRGEDPTPHEQSAMNDYAKTLAINPNNFAATYNIAYRSGQRAARQLAAGKDPRTDLRRAVQYYTRATELRPNYADAWLNLTSVWGRIAQIERTLKLPHAESTESQLEVLNGAIARFPTDLRFYTNRADALRQRGDDLVAEGADGAGRFRAALKDTDFLLEHPPVIWQTHTIRGVILERLGRLAEAVASHEAAVKIAGGAATPANYLKQARAKLGR